MLHDADLSISAALSMSDWFTQLGIGTAPTATTSRSTDDLTVAYAEAVSSLAHRPPQQGRSSSEQPYYTHAVDVYKQTTLSSSLAMSPANETPRDIEDFNIDERAVDVQRMRTFWDNLQPGRNYHDTLELQHFGPLTGLATAGKRELGVGHSFAPVHLAHPTWCDKCGDFIWGFGRQACRCSS
jgi:hypothetical protein